MAIIKSVRTTAHWLVSEATLWRSRDQVMVAAPEDQNNPEGVLMNGTILAAGATASDPHVPWTGTGAISGILFQSLGQGQTEKRTIIAREAEVVGEDIALYLPSGTDLAEATAALAANQIIVR